VDALVGPGQTVRRRGQTAGRPWVELSYSHEGQPWVQRHVSGALCRGGRGGGYSHEGQPWVQRHYVIVAWPDGDFVLVSAQAPEAHAAALTRAADGVAASLAPRPPRG